MPVKPHIIALEEHYYDPEVNQHARGLDATAMPATVRRLDHLGALRLKEMDEAGIDLQVVSHSMPGLQKIDAEVAVPLARRANDRLNEAVRAHPDTFAAFAALPTADPNAAADELERTVTQFGFKGAMVNGLTSGVFFDDKRFWRFSSGHRRSTSRSTCTPLSRILPLSMLTTRITSRNTRGSCAPDGALPSRQRRRAFASY